MRRSLAPFFVLSLVSFALLAAAPAPRPAAAGACDALTEPIKALVKKMPAGCQKDADCSLLDVHLGCPFGCTNLVSKASKASPDYTELKKLARQYHEQEQCPRCKYDCDASPKPEQIKCSSGTCVDSRYAK
jgi:hypothetical protein